MSFSSSDPFFLWYLSPLSGRDILAGSLLVVISSIFMIFDAIVIVVLWKSSKEIIGFRYLLSASIANLLSMAQYGLLDGIAILAKWRLETREGRSWLQLYTDWIWFSCCFHLPIIAWSRLHAISNPQSFRQQSQCMSYTICGGFAWLLSLAICCTTHWQSFYVQFYYEPAVYGLLSEDSTKYKRDGHVQMFTGIHIFVVVIPIVFYSIAMVLLIRRRRSLKDGTMKTEKSCRGQSVETKLILPCILGTVVFIVGQVAITMGVERLSDVDGLGPWTSWTICLLLFLNSALQPVLLVIFSSFIRKGISSLFTIRKKSTLHYGASNIS